jgi:hypothetical protein
MPETPPYTTLAALAGLAADHPLVKLAAAEHERLMRRLGGHASEREQWLVALVVQRTVELEATLHPDAAAGRSDR